MSEKFLSVYRSRSTDHPIDVGSLLGTAQSKQIAENRSRLKPIVETIMVCGEMNLPFRGHRDSGPLSTDAKPIKQEGVFRRLVYERARFDSDLRSHLESAAGNKRYLSPRIQNELIVTIGELIQTEILKDVQQAKYFSVLADDTSDISRQEQFSIVLRIVKDDDIQELFVGFQTVTDLSGAGLAHHLITTLSEQYGLNLNFLVGQGYDGAASMSGRFNGVQAIVQRSYPTCLFTHCKAHVLNLVLSESCSSTVVQVCLRVLKKLISFFTGSVLRTNKLKASIVTKMPETRKSRLINYCETRWVERHDSILVFVELLPAIAHSLEALCDVDDDAYPYLQVLKDFDFIFTVYSLRRALSITVRLSEFLQRADIEVIEAEEQIDITMRVLEDLKSSKEEFQKIFEEAKSKLNSCILPIYSRYTNIFNIADHCFRVTQSDVRYGSRDSRSKASQECD